METMIGIAALIASVGFFILCAGVGVYFLTGAGKQGVEIQRLDDQQRSGPPAGRAP
jgi:hypothetical protein